MTVTNWIERQYYWLLAALDDFALWPVQTLARIAVGMVFLQSGLNKLESWEPTLALFRDEYRLPFIPYQLAAELGTTVEITGSLLLLVGLLSRLATLPLLGMIAVIEVFVYPQAWVEHLTWATLLLLILLRGAGPISIDHLIARLATRRALLHS